jgi:AcrR family transcriptional regulator
MITRSIPRVSKKQRQILITAEGLFIRHGMKRVTVEEICQEANVSKMTFYKYFANKAELVKRIWEGWIAEFFNKFDEINAMDIPFPEKIELMFKWKEEFISKIGPELIKDFLQTDFELERVKQRFLEFIVEGQKRGDIRPEIRPEFIMAVIDKLNELARDADLLKRYPSYIEFNRELKDFFWFGILARPEPRTKDEPPEAGQ